MNAHLLSSDDAVYWPPGLQFHMPASMFMQIYYCLLIVPQILSVIFSQDVIVKFACIRRVTSAICIACVFGPSITGIIYGKINRILMAAYLLIMILLSITELIDVICAVELNEGKLIKYIWYKTSIISKIFFYMCLLRSIQKMSKLNGLSAIQKRLCVEKLIKTEPTIDNCSICLEQLTENVYQTPCNHKYHLNCISTWFNNSSLCPYCRSLTVSQEEIALNI